MTSTSAVNTVVETLIGDWDFFFQGEVNFYETMSRDELFPDNGGFPLDKEHSVIHPKTDQMSMSMIVGENPKNGPFVSAMKMSHSRSSSHDTSLILLSDPPMKSSQSNSSLSDTSPTTGSPKLPSRRKPKAPVPPAMTMTPQPPKAKLEAKVSAPISASKVFDTSTFSYIDSDPALHVEELRSGMMRRAGSTENILSKPDRPPRPVVVNAECQTTSRAVVRHVPLKDKSSGFPARPVAAPRTTVLTKGEMQKSEENLEVAMREKPAIPDRPVTLMRPASFRAATGGSGSPTSILMNDNLLEELKSRTSFENKTGVRRNNSLREGKAQSESSNGEMPKQVTMYNIEKQQVAIVDVPFGGSPKTVRRELFTSDGGENKENNNNLGASTDALNTSSDDQHQNVPPSPREGKIKRPQVPPPARPKSSDGDSTNL